MLTILLFSLPLLLIIFNGEIRFVIFLIYVGIKNSKVIGKIPGPSGYPIIGNFLELVTQKPEELWSYCRNVNNKYYPIYKITNFGFASVGLQSPEDIEILLSSATQIKKGLIYKSLRLWLQEGLLLSWGEKWQKRRKILTSAFHFNILKQFSFIFSEQTAILMEKLENECDKPYINVFPLITQFALDSISETAMGSQLIHSKEKREEYSRAIKEMANLLVYRTIRPWSFINAFYKLSPAYRKEMKVLKVLHDFTYTVIEERKRNFENSDILPPATSEEGINKKKRLAMLDHLIYAQNHHDQIDDRGIQEEVDTFMFAGHHTTTASICFTLMALACNPDIQDKVVQELEEIFGNSDRDATYDDLQSLRYLELVLKESLRMYPSVPLITRMVTEDLRTASGYLIPAYTNVHIFIYDLHHNPRLFPNPHKFNPDRFLPENSQGRHPYSYIPFSAGSRNCIGQKFAYLELKIVLSTILRKFKLKPIDRFEDLTILIDFVMNPAEGIKVKFEKR